MCEADSNKSSGFVVVTGVGVGYPCLVGSLPLQDFIVVVAVVFPPVTGHADVPDVSVTGVEVDLETSSGKRVPVSKSRLGHDDLSGLKHGTP